MGPRQVYDRVVEVRKARDRHNEKKDNQIWNERKKIAVKIEKGIE